MNPIRYTQVREFRYDDISLKDYPHLDPNHTKVEDDIRAVLQAKVNDMIVAGRAAVLALAEQAQSGDLIEPEKRNYKVIDPHKIIIRLRVEHEGFPAISQQRFGALFIGEVANPADMLLLAKRKQLHRSTTVQSATSADANPGAYYRLQQLFAEGVEDEIQKIKIEDLVKETLMNSKNNLRLLAETEMAQALDDYIVKKLPNAIIDVVTESLERTQSCLNKDKTADGAAAILRATAQVKNKTEEDMRKEGLLKKQSKETSSQDEDVVGELGNHRDEDEDDHGATTKSASTRRADRNSVATTSQSRSKGANARGKRKSSAVDSSAEDDDQEPADGMDIEEEYVPPPSRSNRNTVIPVLN